MQKNIALLLLLLLGIQVSGQKEERDKRYTRNSGELLFQFSDVTYNNRNISTNLRFTMFFHYGNYVNYDFNNYIGLYSGGAIRNVGFITEDEGHLTVASNEKIKRRAYTLGVPLAVKVGNFDKHYWFYAGGEYELLFHYKQKLFVGNDKTKYTEWFSDRTNLFVPSVFAGIQFPGGIDLRFKYYLDDFLNKDFSGEDFGNPVDYADYEQTQVFYISLSFNIKASKLKDVVKTNGVQASLD